MILAPLNYRIQSVTVVWQCCRDCYKIRWKLEKLRLLQHGLVYDLQSFEKVSFLCNLSSEKKKTKKGNSIRNETKTKTILSKSLKPKYKYN